VQVSADDPALRGSDAWLIAADRLGAGPGELVLAAHGSRCRDLTIGEAVATKDVVIAIVDHAQIFTSVGDDR
jgi:microcompartment protein CcmK/EutM